MKHFPSGVRQTKPQATGFTLLELLVVIGIIVFLITMTVMVVTSSLTTARTNRTKATIRKIDGLLTQRLEAFTMGLKSQNLTGTSAATAFAKKDLLKKHFPQSLMEAFNQADTPNDPTASSEALYEFLINGESFGAPAVDKDAFDSSEVQDTDGDDRPEFVDGWGQPLRFYRWPTRLIRPAPDGQESTPQTVVMQGSGANKTWHYQYPLDPDFNFGPAGLDASVFFGPIQPSGGAPSRKTMSNPMPQLSHELNDPLAKDGDDPSGNTVNRNNPTAVQNYENKYHTPDTWSTPLIISAGPDGILGLWEPNDKGNFGHLAQPKHDQLDGAFDNITNRNLQP